MPLEAQICETEIIAGKKKMKRAYQKKKSLNIAKPGGKEIGSLPYTSGRKGKDPTDPFLGESHRGHQQELKRKICNIVILVLQ